MFYIATGMLLMVYSGSMLMPQINDYVGYGNICRYVPDNTEVVTLRVHRPENIDVYIGRGITDYGRDFEKFIHERIDNFDGTPYTLITKTSKLKDYPRIMELIYANTFVRVGEYTEVDVVTVPEKSCISNE